jgi:outer membrane protein assembly factor BamA
MTRAAALAALLLGVPRPGRSQEDAPWVFRWLAYPAYNSLEGVSGNAVLSRRKPPPAGPIPATAGIELTGRISWSGTRSLQLVFDYPGLWSGWRLLAVAGAERARRSPYYGLGNDSERNDSLERANGPAHYNRYTLLRTTALLTVHRQLAGPVRLLAGAQWRHYRALPLESVQTKLGDDLAAALVSDTGRFDGAEFRLGLLYDTRDEEASPSSGVFLEALTYRSLAGVGDFDYARYALSAREFIALGELTVLGLRQSVELAAGDLPFFVAYERMTSWRPEDGFGGPTSLRAHLPGRFLAPNRALISADLRYKKWDVPVPTSPFRLWFIAFADAGRLWNGGESPSLSGLHADAGLGVRLQFAKATLFGLDFGTSSDSPFEFASAFSFAF